MSNLFDSLTIKNYKIKNRIVVPPMVCFGYTSDNGYITKANIDHYTALAKGGAGVIIIEAHAVEKDGRVASYTQPGIWSDLHIEGLKSIADICHQNEVLGLVQLHHAGLKTPKDVTNLVIGPSDYDKDGIHAVSMTLSDIKRIQESFLKAAIRVKKAGFHGIELHGAHGYLIDQFMSPVTNHRTDEYGGNIENRMKFGLEIVEMIKKELGKDFIIGYRMGGNAPNLEEGITIAKALEVAGIDLLHVSAGIVDEVVPEVPKDFPYNWIIYIGTEVKKVVKIPVIVVNNVRTPQQASFLIENNLADFVAIGRGHLVDPEWSNKAYMSKNPLQCFNCPKCLWFKDSRNCPGKKK